jgi:hypothetical protein
MITVATESRTPQVVGPETRVTVAHWALTFVPFGLGLVAAMWLAELTQDLRLFRTIYAIRVSLLLAIPALALFPFRNRTPSLRNTWRLFWTFSFLAYVVHFLYAWFGVFGGQLETARLHPQLYHVPEEGATILDLVRAHQGDVVAYSNIAVTGLWLFDVTLAWVGGGQRGGERWAVVPVHGLAWLDVLISFLVATIFFYKNNIQFALGWLMAGVVALSLLARLLSRRPAPTPTEAA